MLAMLMGIKALSCTELHALLPSAQACVIDVNAPSRWAAAHVPGARNLDPRGFTAADLPGDRAALLVFYCSNPMCTKAPIAARRAKGMGYTQVRVMSAGIQGWLDAGLPVGTSMAGAH